MPTTHYDAFISYSHSADGKLAPAVQSGLQRLGRSWRSVRALKVFRDETGLSVNPHLWSSIQDALEHSRYFVLMASPDAARSEWVNREIETWLSEMPGDRILPVLTDGELVWDEARNDFDREASTGVPPALFGRLTEEPRYLDLRWAHHESQLNLRNGRFRDAIADLAAPMHGISKDELQSEDLRQYRRRMRVAWAAGATVVLLAVASVIGAIAALDARSQANGLADTAQIERVAAESGAVRTTQPDLARLLAVEAFRRADNATTRAALQQAAFAPLSPARVIQPRGASASSQTFSRVALAADGRVAATMRGEFGQPQTLELFDDTTGRSLMRLDMPAPPSGTESVIALDARGDRVAYYDGRNVSVFDVGTKQKIGTIDAAATSGSIAIALDADGGRVAVARPLIEVFDLATAQPVGPAIRAAPDPSSLALAPDGSRVAAVLGFGGGGGLASTGDQLSRALTGAAASGIQTVTSSATAQLWDVASGAAIPLPDVPTQVRSVAFAPAGDRVAIGTDSSGVRIDDLSTGAHRAVPGALATFASDGTVVTVWADGTTTRFDAATGHAVDIAAQLGNETNLASGQFAWLAPGRLVTGAGRIAVWNLAEADRLSRAPIGAAGAQLYAVSQDGRLLLIQDHPLDTLGLGDGPIVKGSPAAVAAEASAAVALVATSSGKVVHDGVGAGFLQLFGGTFADRGKRFAAGQIGALGIARVPAFDTVNSRPTDLTGYVSAVAASHDGLTLAYARTSNPLSGPTDTKLELADARNGRTRGAPIDLGASQVNRLEFSADGRHVIAMGGDAPVLVDLRSRHVAALPSTAPQGLADAAYSPDGRLLALAAGTGVVFLDAATLQQVGTSWQEPGIIPTSVVFSPDSSELAVGVSDNGLQTARLVDVATRTTVGVFPGGVFATPAFLGRGILVAPGPGGIYRWTLDPEEWVAAACAGAGHNLTRADWIRYLPSGASYRATCPAFPSGR
jgi:WD40 repeat protein